MVGYNKYLLIQDSLTFFFFFFFFQIKKLYGPFLWMDSTSSRLEPLRGGSLLFTTSSQNFMVLILSTSEGWKAKSTLILVFLVYFSLILPTLCLLFSGTAHSKWLALWCQLSACSEYKSVAVYDQTKLI